MVSVLKELIAEYIEKNSSAASVSMITVTDCVVSSDTRRAKAFITVFPETAEEKALDFAKRKRSEIREYIKDHSRMRSLPFIDIEIDRGEKNRQRIDELLRNDH